jgi:hypothetical protein
MSKASAWGWFGAWAVAGALVVFAFLTGFSIGLLVLPFALAAVWLVASRSPSRSSAFGLVSGAGLICLVVWVLNRDYVPCPANGMLSSEDIPPGETSIGCGGLDPQPWLVAAIVLILAGVGAFVLAHRRDGTSALG